VLGEPGFGVEREQSQHHLQAAALQVWAGKLRVRVQRRGQDLGRYGAQRGLGVAQRCGCGLDPAACRW
jgi:hypothetical protein